MQLVSVCGVDGFRSIGITVCVLISCRIWFYNWHHSGGESDCLLCLAREEPADVPDPTPRCVTTGNQLNLRFDRRSSHSSRWNKCRPQAPSWGDSRAARTGMRVEPERSVSQTYHPVGFLLRTGRLARRSPVCVPRERSLPQTRSTLWRIFSDTTVGFLLHCRGWRSYLSVGRQAHLTGTVDQSATTRAQYCHPQATMQLISIAFTALYLPVVSCRNDRAVRPAGTRQV